MPGLNERFMETIADENGRLRIAIAAPIGYVIFRHEQEGQTIGIDLDAWREPYIYIRGAERSSLLKGGISLRGTSFEKGGLHPEGLHIGIEDENGDRRYWIADSNEEEVKVSYWDPDANTPDPQDGSIGGEYGPYSQVSKEEAEDIKEMASRIINTVKIAIDSQLAAS